MFEVNVYDLVLAGERREEEIENKKREEENFAVPLEGAAMSQWGSSCASLGANANERSLGI